jgi:FtsH-binding integral membrane protein
MSRFPSAYSRPVMPYESVGMIEPGVLSRFMSNVYAWMSAGLALTAVVAWWIASQGTQYLATIFNPGTLILLVVVELGLVIAISYAINKISAGVATALFLLYSAINGLTLSAVFLVYRLPDIGIAFAVTAGMFGGMSLIGYVTKIDLTRFRSFLIMGLIGLVIASIVNIFVASSALYWVVTYAGVGLFLALTAYDTQVLKQIAYSTQGDPAMANRLAISGALKLYLDFINLFLFVLRILGSRRN